MKKKLGKVWLGTPEEVRLADRLRADGIRQAVQERWLSRGGVQQNSEETKDAEVPSGHGDLGGSTGILDPAVQNKDFLEIPYSARRRGSGVVRWESGLKNEDQGLGPITRMGWPSRRRTSGEGKMVRETGRSEDSSPEEQIGDDFGKDP